MKTYYKSLISFFLLILIIPGSMFGQESGPVQVSIKPIVSVIDQKVYLKDIAEITCSDSVKLKKFQDIAICGYLLPLKPRLVTKEFVASRIKQHQFHPSTFTMTGAEQISINLRSIEITQDDYKKAVTEYLKSLPHMENSVLEIHRLPQNIIAPEKDVRVAVIPRKYGNFKGLMSLSIGIYNGDDLYRRLIARIKRKVFADAVVAVRNISKEAIVRSEDILLKKIDVTGAGNYYCTDISQVIGKRATSFISENEVLQLKMVEKNPAIKKGDLVDIIVKRGAVKISLKGKAKEDGYLGEEILVENSENNATLRGMVVSGSKIEIL